MKLADKDGLLVSVNTKPDDALPRQYAAQMMLGTAKMVLETGQHPGVLKDSVCSPAGSTIQGVRTLEERGMRAAVFDAVTVAYEKNVELKKESD